MPGVAVTSVKIDGVHHELSTIPGVKEDVTEIILNLKGLTAKLYGEGPKTIYIEAEGECVVTAGDIKTDSEVDILVPDMHIATLGPGAKLYMEIVIDRGRGYVSAEKNKALEKLSAYAEGREVTREDIDLLCIRRIESDGYSLAINILRGNAAMVFTRLRELDVQNYEPYAIIGIIGFSLADIYRAKLARSSGRSVADVAKDFSYAKNREFAVKNAYSECGNISAERIRKTLEILSETDLMLKTRSRGKDGDMLTLEQGLARSMALRC